MVIEHCEPPSTFWIELYRTACDLRKTVVSVEEFLREHTQKPNEEELTDLVYAEYMERLERQGTGSLEDLCRRFPTVANSLRRQIAFQAAMDAHGDSRRDDGNDTFDEFRTLPGEGQVINFPRLDRFQMIEMVGSGGQGEVYRALDTQLQRDVVLKFLKMNASPLNHLNYSSLVQEGQSLAKLKHPGIAQVYEVGEYEGRPYVAMEMIAGRNLLADSLTRSRSPTEAALFVAKLADALAAAHQQGVIHCDLKPQNILVTKDDEPVLIDFGLAECIPSFSEEMNSTSGVSGTAQYMSPEQAVAEARQITYATDIFGLGGVLYFLLTGHAPYQGFAVSEIFGRIRNADWNRERLEQAIAPEKIKAICRRALAHEPRERFSGMQEFAQALRHAARGDQKNKLVTLGLLAAAIVLLSIGVAYQFLNQKPSSASSESLNKDLELAVKVFRDGKNYSLADALPILESDEIQFSANGPGQGTAFLLEVDGSGQLSLIDQYESKEKATENWSYPREADKTVNFVGQSGTEALILLWCSETKPDGKALVDQWNSDSRSWPVLPTGTLMRVSLSGTKYLQKSRELSAPKASDNPALQVQARLEYFCESIRKYGRFDSIAFTKAD